MKKILSFFKKKEKEETNIITSPSNEQIKEYINEDIQMDFFNKSVNFYYASDQKKYLYDNLDALNNSLQSNQDILFETSIKDAIQFMDYTGESFHSMLDAEDTPEEAESFIEKWNSGDICVLTNFIDRWFSKEEAKAIAEDVQKHQSTYNSLQELQLQTAKSILDLHLTKYNFGNVYLAIKDDLMTTPSIILEYMHIATISFSVINDIPIWTLQFECDWEIEHGIDWVIKGATPIYVGADGSSLLDDEIITWDSIHTNMY